MSGSRWDAMKKLQSSIKTPLVRANAHDGTVFPNDPITPFAQSPSSSPAIRGQDGEEVPASSGKRKRVDIDHVESPKTPGLASPLKGNTAQPICRRQRTKVRLPWLLHRPASSATPSQTSTHHTKEARAPRVSRRDKPTRQTTKMLSTIRQCSSRHTILRATA